MGIQKLNHIFRSTLCVEAAAKCETIGPLKRALKLRSDLIHPTCECFSRLFHGHHDTLVKQVRICTWAGWGWILTLRLASFLFCCLRPKAKDLGITRVVVLVGFFVWSMPDQLPPLCYPHFFNFYKFFIFYNYHWILSITHLSIFAIHVSVYLSITISICQSINQYSIIAEV